MSAALKALHATLRHVGLDDDDKRGLYSRVTGKSSARHMDDDERRAVTAELKRLYPHLKTVSKSAQTKQPDGRTKLTGPYAGKLQALWIAGWNLGLVRNRDDAALEAFVKRQTGLDAVRFCHDHHDATKAIEALKGWLARDGGVDWRIDGLRPDWAQTNGYRIAKAQGRILGDSNAVMDACAALLKPYSVYKFMAYMTDENWIAVMNTLGHHVRAKAAKKGAAA
ncbi:MAG: regulatory protein GemA [Pseudomonadota bacterium]